MGRDELERAIRAACHVARDDELVVLGSQAVLGQFPDAPGVLRFSREVDVDPRNHPDRSDLIDGVLGEASQFQHTHGFYVHGVGPETAVLPERWEWRLVPVRGRGTAGNTGWCLEAHDLAVSKLAAGRPKDLAYVEALFRHALADPEEVARRSADVRVAGVDAELVTARARAAAVRARGALD